MNTAPGVPNQKRKKSDANSDLVNAQVKCLNEKRRRELENAYISELANLISTTDMAQNGKKDKCVILQETVNQIKNIKGQQEGSTQDAVQQGEVSSSRPAISAHDFGPLLLEALEAFVFIVNSECRIEYITEHVTEFLKYRREELQGKSIFNYIHHGDHGSFSSVLLPMIRSAYAFPGEQPQKSRSLVCRMLVKNPFESTETMEEKQKRVTEYESMQLSILKKIKSPESPGGGESGADSGDGNLLVCIARKTVDTKATVGAGSAPGVAGAGVPTANPSAETVITRLDPSGRIVGVETQNLTPAHAQHFTPDLVGQSLLGLVWVGDKAKVMAHIEKVVTSPEPGPHPLDNVRLCGVVPGKFFRVQTRTKRFNSANADHVVFINAMHTIIGEEVGLESPGLLSPPAQMAAPRAAPRAVGPPPVSGLVSAASSVGYGSIGGYSGANTITLNSSAAVSTLTVPADTYNGNDLLSELFASSSPIDSFGASSGGSSTGAGGGFSGGAANVSGGGAGLNSLAAISSASGPPPPPPPVNTSPQMNTSVQSRVAAAGGGLMYVNTSLVSGGGSRPSSRQSQNSTPTPHAGGPLAAFSPVSQQQQPSPLSYPQAFQFSPSPMAADFGRQTPASVASIDAGDDGQMKGLLAARSLSADQLDSKDSLIQPSLLGYDDPSSQKLLHPSGGVPGGGPGGGPPAGSAPKPSPSGGNNLLKQMLNDRGDEQNEQRAKVKQNEKVLMQLLNSGAAGGQQPQPSPQHQQPSPLQQPQPSPYQQPQPSPLQQHQLPQQPSPLQHHQQDMLNSMRRPSGGASPRVSEAFDISAGDLLRGSKRTSQDGDGDPLRAAKKQVRYPSGGGMLELAPPSGPHDTSAQGLHARNRMLASLLSSKPSSSPTVPTTIAQARPSDLPQDKLPRPDELRSKLKDQSGLKGREQGQEMSPAGAPDPFLLLGAPGRPPPQSQHQQHSNMNAAAVQQLGRPLSAPVGHSGPPQFLSSISAGDVCSELDDILDVVETIKSQTNGGHGSNFNISEKQAIHAIQQKLMSVESLRPPMTPSFSAASTQGTQASGGGGAGFPPPYHQGRPRLGGFTSHINMVRPHMSQFPVSGGGRLTSQQQHQQGLVERSRLLQQQQQQRLLVNHRQSAAGGGDPAAAAAAAASYQNIDNIINAAPPPNVSLQQQQQRLVAGGGGQDSQASPNYSSAVGMSPLGHQMSPGPPVPSPHSPSLAGGQPTYPGAGSGYSGAPPGAGGPAGPGGGQVSPRAPPGAGGPVASPFSGAGGGAQLSPGGPPASQQSQARAAAAAAAGKLQQQNPELNAQLSGTFGVRGQSYQLPQRNQPLPRQPHFPQQPQQQQQQQQLFQQQQQQLRMQRQASVPPAATQPPAMPGGRHYVGDPMSRLISPTTSVASYSPSYPMGSHPGPHLTPHQPPGAHPHAHAVPLPPPLPQGVDMYAGGAGGGDERAAPHAAGQPVSTPGGAGSSNFVRQELRRRINSQQRQMGGRGLQPDLDDFNIDVPPAQGHEAPRWSVPAGGAPAPGPPPLDDSSGGGGGGGGPGGATGGHPTSLLRDLLMSD